MFQVISGLAEENMEDEIIYGIVKYSSLWNLLPQRLHPSSPSNLDPMNEVRRLLKLPTLIHMYDPYLSETREQEVSLGF